METLLHQFRQKFAHGLERDTNVGTVLAGRLPPGRAPISARPSNSNTSGCSLLLTESCQVLRIPEWVGTPLYGLGDSTLQSPKHVEGDLQVVGRYERLSTQSRRRDAPCGTAGKRTGVTRMPSSRNRPANSVVVASSPKITGMIGVFPMLRCHSQNFRALHARSQRFALVPLHALARSLELLATPGLRRLRMDRAQPRK